MLVRKWPIICVFAAALLLGACETPWHEAAGMVPSVDVGTLTPIGKSIQVADVKPGEVRTAPLLWGKKSDIRPDQIEEALAETIRKSNLLNVAPRGSSADYQLHTQIVSQELRPGFTISQILFMRYELIESESGNRIWADSILSQYDATMEEAGQLGRLKAANEGAVKDNFTKLLKQFSKLAEAGKL